MESFTDLKNKKLSDLKGVGDKTEKLFEKLKIADLDQLLHYYPRAYDAYGAPVSYDMLRAGMKYTIEAFIRHQPIVRKGGRTAVTVLELEADFTRVELVWFNMPYLRSVLKKGSYHVFRGMVSRKGGKWVMEHPEIFTNASYAGVRDSIQPVYGLTAGLSSKAIAKAVRQIFDKYEIADYLPKRIQKEYELCGREDALRNIHFPADENTLRAAEKRIVFDEFLFFLLGLQMIRTQSDSAPNEYPVTDFAPAEELIGRLPYSLTGAQKKVFGDIRTDMSGTRVMNRLIQGDVGSGKTIIAFLAMISAASAGYQAALMAPTEILALQHYNALLELIRTYNIPLKEPVLLTSSLTASEKRAVYEKLSAGDVSLVIGTHALIQDKVSFRDLALVVTDEQHRFGVEQRASLSDKGRMPHVLVMSATPIPRTLALIIYGDLDISVIDELPAHRLPIKNAVMDSSMREKAWYFIAKEIKVGHQAFIICPMIEPNEDISCENVTEYTEKVRNFFGKSAVCAMLHGRMSASEKDQIMSDFAAHKTDILVSTTVIEVGIDIPNATVMMIENADRFGMAQLHQLRGRVGRGSAQSYCMFLKSEGREEDNARLDTLGSSNDGFYIASEDLKQRGQGDLYGLRQSGEAGFNLADMFRHSDILELASDAAKKITAEDPGLTLPENELIARRLNELTSAYRSS